MGQHNKKRVINYDLNMEKRKTLITLDFGFKGFFCFCAYIFLPTSFCQLLQVPLPYSKPQGYIVQSHTAPVYKSSVCGTRKK